jgi:hypothetical protein
MNLEACVALVPIKLRHWRLTHDQFERDLRPYLTRFNEQNIEYIYAILVQNKKRKEIAAESGKNLVTIHSLLSRAWKVYVEANVQRQKPITAFITEED